MLPFVVQARKLDVDKDMRPVVEFLLEQGVSVGDVGKVRRGPLQRSVPVCKPLWRRRPCTASRRGWPISARLAGIGTVLHRYRPRQHAAGA